MRRFLLILVSGVLLQISLSAKVSEADFAFIHINRSNSDISYERVNEVFQDSRGLLWVGTAKGLNRFDGYSFTVYDKDALGVPSDCIYCIAEDSAGNVWTGTDRGVSVYDYRNDRFVPFRTVSDKGTVIDNKVNNILCDGDRIYLTVNHQGLFSYDLKSGCLINYFVKDGAETLPQGIRRLAIGSGGDFWLALYFNDLYRCPAGLDSLESVSLWGVDFRKDNIEGIVQSKENSHIIYAVSTKNGLCRIDTKLRRTTHLLNLPAGAVKGLLLEPGRCLWIPTVCGLWRYDLLDGSHIVLKSDAGNRFSLSDDCANSVLIDNAGRLWVGTKDGGLNYSDPEMRNFIRHDSCGGHSLENSMVSGFADDGAGTMWVTTEKGEIYRYDVADDVLSRYDTPDISDFVSSPCFYQDRLWIASLNGLIRLDPRTGAVRRYESFPNATVEDNGCYAVYKSDSGLLYVGTTLGLLRYEPGSDSFVSIDGFDGKFVTGIDEDGRGCLWISTYADGVCRYDPSSSGEPDLRWYGSPEFFSTNKFTGLLVDGADRVWPISYSDGFYCFDWATETFVRYDSKTLPGLPTDVFFRAVDDVDGNIWLSSDAGIVRFNPATGDVFHYTTSEGLLDNAMKKGAAKDGRGNIFFGSQNGFIRFNPEQFRLNETSPKLVVTKLCVGDDTVLPGPRSPIDRNIDIADEIRLKFKQNSFGISASLLSLSTLASNRVFCLLEGYDREPRILTGGGKTVFWYNVPAGRYTLLLKGSNDGKTWTAEHKAVTVIVERPWFASSWAIAGYVLFLVLLSLVLAYLHSRMMRKKLREQRESFETRMQINALSEKLPVALLITGDTALADEIRSAVIKDCSIVSVTGTKMAFEALAQMKASLVIADADSRGFDCEDFCTSLHGSPKWSRLPVLVLSSDTSTERKIAFADSGAAMTIDKPLSVDWLTSAIRNIFRKELSIEAAISQSVVSMKIHRLKLDSKDEDFINLLEKSVTDNFSNPDFDSAALEKAMAMSRSSLVRRMKSLFDTTPNEYLKQKRLEIAARMLEENQVRVNEICYAVGFKYPSYFTKCFKQAYGVLPAEYKKSLKEKQNLRG